MAVKEGSLLAATQIAYADLDEAFYNLSKNGEGITLTEAVIYAKKHKNELGGLGNYIKGYDEDVKGNIINVRFKQGYGNIGDWKIFEPVNDNIKDGTGLYACILDIGSARILACRGSEGAGNFLTNDISRRNIDQDWIEADFMLLNSVQTKQEEALRKYMTDNADLLSEKPWTATGHSLGGALADHAAVVSAEENIGNFSGAVNFDGPGHSQEYIKKHSAALKRVSGKMTHKKASIVGNLLFDFPGAKQEYIKTSNESRFVDKDGSPLSTIAGKKALFLKHDTQYWVLDEDGSTIAGERLTAEWAIEKLSKIIERLPSPVGNMLPAILLKAVHGVEWTADLLNGDPDSSNTLAENMVINVAGFILNHPLVIAPIAIPIVADALVVITFMIIGELAAETAEKTAAEISQGVSKTVSWLSDKTADLFEAVKLTFNAAVE